MLCYRLFFIILLDLHCTDYIELWRAQQTRQWGCDAYLLLRMASKATTRLVDLQASFRLERSIRSGQAFLSGLNHCIVCSCESCSGLWESFSWLWYVFVWRQCVGLFERGIPAFRAQRFRPNGMVSEIYFGCFFTTLRGCTVMRCTMADCCNIPYRR